MRLASDRPATGQVCCTKPRHRPDVSEGPCSFPARFCIGSGVLNGLESSLAAYAPHLSTSLIMDEQADCHGPTIRHAITSSSNRLFASMPSQIGTWKTESPQWVPCLDKVKWSVSLLLSLSKVTWQTQKSAALMLQASRIPML